MEKTTAKYAVQASWRKKTKETESTPQTGRQTITFSADSASVVSSTCSNSVSTKLKDQVDNTYS